MKKKKWKSWLTTIVLVAVIGGVIHHASRHAPTGPAEGVAINGKVAEAPTDHQTIRIGTFNIHAGKGSDGRRDLGRVADCLGNFDLDFVALHEVRGGSLWHPQGQTERLGRQLGMAWLFAPVVRVWYHLEAGNGLLTTLPTTFWHRIPLTRKYDRSYRNALLVGLKHRGRTVHVLLSHINRRHEPERRAQLRAVIALYLSLAEPSILLGDMNSKIDDPQIRGLLETPGVHDPVGELLGPKIVEEKAPGRIDWIFTRGLCAVDAGIVDKGASDHPLVWAELELP